MSEQHLSGAALEDYVIGILDAESASLVETHVASCAACAKRLMGEAEVLVAFAQIADRSLARTERRATFARRSSVVMGTLAMAAAAFLFVSRSSSATAHDEPSAGSPSPSQVAAASAPAASFDRPITEADASTASAQLDAVGDAAMRVGRD